MIPRIVLRSSFLLVLTFTVLAFPPGVWSETTYIQCPNSITPGIGTYAGDLPEGWEAGAGAYQPWPTEDRALFYSRELEVHGSSIRRLKCTYEFKFYLPEIIDPATTGLIIRQNEPEGMTCEEYVNDRLVNLNKLQNKFKCVSNNKIEIPGALTPRAPIVPTKQEWHDK